MFFNRQLVKRYHHFKKYQNKHICNNIKKAPQIVFSSFLFNIKLYEPLFRYAFRISISPQNSRILRRYSIGVKLYSWHVWGAYSGFIRLIWAYYQAINGLIENKKFLLDIIRYIIYNEYTIYHIHRIV